LLTHYKFRKKNGCPPAGSCQLKGFPYTSIAAVVILIAVIICMPLVPGQGYGLIAGVILVLLYIGIYLIKKKLAAKK
jgi:AAT family amino acid transporter